MLTTRKPYRPILIGGLIAGALDISYACIFSYLRSGRKPIVILQSVASGALGRSAFDGGAKTAALGLFFHFLIALIAAAVYYFASRALRVMVAIDYESLPVQRRTTAVLCGLLYGILVYAFMNCVVLPLSAIHSRTFPWSYPKSVLIGGLLIHMLGIGLPIALITRKYSK